MFWALLSIKEVCSCIKQPTNPFIIPSMYNSFKFISVWVQRWVCAQSLEQPVGLSVLTVPYTDDGPVRADTCTSLYIIIILTKCVCALISHILTIQYINSPQAVLGASEL
jgi:hypothetical protein